MKNDEGDLQEAFYVYINAFNENKSQVNIALSFSGISCGQHFNIRKKEYVPTIEILQL